MRYFVVSLFILFCFYGVTLCTASTIPLIVNAGFEQSSPDNPISGWGWYARAQASFRLDTERPHSGKNCLVFTNESDVAPEVYARLFQNVPILPNTKYELVVWVRANQVTEGLHFTDWGSYMLSIPSGTYDWQRLSFTFSTRDGQGALNLGINVTNRCKALAIDDISLRPKGTAFEGKAVSGSLLVPGQVIGDNQEAPLQIMLNSSLDDDGSISVSIKAGQKNLFEKSDRVAKGDNVFEWQWNTGDVPARNLECQLTVFNSNGKKIASVKQEIEKITPSVLSAELDALGDRLGEFETLYRKCAAKNIPLDYPTTARTLLEQFIPLTRRDIRKGEQRRANFAIKDMNVSLNDALTEMKAYLHDPDLAPNAKRYQTGEIQIDGVSFIGERKDSLGRLSEGPVFFCGMGHFSQVREDMPKWPKYGVNIIQVEVGPAVTLPTGNTIDLEPAKEIVRVLDDAARNNVKVNILLSPHYFPKWAMEKWPHLGKGGGGFLGFCVDDPKAKKIMKKFLKTVVPMFKDKPAFHSFCLSNEPMFNNAANCDNTKPLWVEYLTRVHGDVHTMNTRYGKNFASFEEVHIPGNEDYTAPQFYDYCIFNQERFAGWHKWMADVIHEIAPNAPVHAKAMWLPVNMRGSVSWGVDPELFGELSQINGNDCAIWPGGDPWGISWHSQNMYYDLQRSVARKPIFNSENHISIDGSTAYIPPEHYRTTLWQGAIHGQGATTIWVWERASDPSDKNYQYTACFYGNVMDRPGCAQAVGTTCLDLNRFAEEVTALENAQAPVAVLYSMASIARNGRYLEVMGRAYTALNFCGVKVDFITEKQLTKGKGNDYKMIVLPDATNVAQPALNSLKGMSESVRLVTMGKSLKEDPYETDYAPSKLSFLRDRALALPADASPEGLWPVFREELARLGGLSADVSVVDATSGKPVWGVEWLSAEVGDRTVVNIVNLLNKPVDVKVLSHGKDSKAHDLLSLGGCEKVRRLKPITPVLAEIGR